MITLKCYQYLGRPIPIQKIDFTVKKYISEQISVDSTADLSTYSKLTRHRHIKIIREYLQINPDKKERRKIMKEAALTAASTKENLADIINCVIEELVKSRFELPTFQKLVRLARAARTLTNNENYETIFNALSDEQKQLINKIIGLEKVNEKDDKDLLSWTMLKLEPKKPTANNIKKYILYVTRMRSLRQNLNINLDFIAPARIEQLRDEAIIADLHDMKEMRPVKRYALVTIFIYMKTAAAIDDLLQVFITWIKNIVICIRKIY